MASLESLDRGFGCWSDQDDYESSSISDSSSGFLQSDLQSDLWYPPGARDTAAPINWAQTDQRSQYTSTSSRRSTGSDGISHSPCDGSVCSFPSCTPHGSAHRGGAGISASTSELSDPVLQSLASRTPPETPMGSSTGQITPPGSLSPSSSDGRTESDESDSQSTASSITTEGSQDADLIFVPDPEHDDQAARAAEQASLLHDLEFPAEYRDKPRFCDANDNNAEDIFMILRDIHKYLDAEGPWMPSAEDGRRRISDEVALAPPTGPVYDEYYSPLSRDTRGNRKFECRRQAASGRRAQPKPITSCNETATSTGYQRDISPYTLAQCSSAYIESQGERSRNYDDRYIERTSANRPQPQIYRPVDGWIYSVETFVHYFYPSFLVSHLYRSSVNALITDLYGPRDLVYDVEYDLGFDLGFGPPIQLKVCAFTPKDTKDLRTYQKAEGKDTLNVQESLPIVLNEFPLESQAGELDTWLDEMIDSNSGLADYVQLMMLRQQNHPYTQLLKALMSWYMASKNNLSENAQTILRRAVKLLITTTLLSLVPKVTEVPSSLSNLLPPQTSTQPGLAPRVLTRQIKASIYYLQRHFLAVLYSHFRYPDELSADVKIGVAFLVTYVLDLVRTAGRHFAKYSTAFNPNLVVSDEDVMEYEAMMKSQLFGRVQASVGDAVGRKSSLADTWRNTGSIFKGKEKESDEHILVFTLLNNVL